MNMQSGLIAGLPLSIACGILKDWLCVKEVASLDSAHCSSLCRGAFLELLASKEFGIDIKIKIGAPIEGDSCVTDYLLSFGHAVRKVRFKIAASAQDVMRIAIHCRKLMSLTTNIPNVSSELRELLWYNSNLEDLRYDFVLAETFSVAGLSLRKLHTLSLKKLASNVIGEHIIQLVGSQLLRLNLFNCESLDSATLCDWLKLCPKLRSLGLGRCSTADAAVVATLAASCPQLTNLELYYAREVTSESFTKALEKLTSLRAVDLRYCPRLKLQCLKALASRCGSRLEVLYLNAVRNFSLAAIEAVLRKCTALRAFCLEADPDAVYDAAALGLVFAALPTTTTTLRIRKGVCTDAALGAIATNCPQLQHLELFTAPVSAPATQYAPFTKAGLFALTKGCFNLRTLAIPNPLEIDDLARMMWRERCPLLSIVAAADFFDFGILELPI